MSIIKLLKQTQIQKDDVQAQGQENLDDPTFVLNLTFLEYKLFFVKVYAKVENVLFRGEIHSEICTCFKCQNWWNYHKFV